MNKIICHYHIAYDVLRSLATLAEFAKLDELHIIDSFIYQALEGNRVPTAERSRVIVDCRALLGPAFQLHVDAKQFVGIVKILGRTKQASFCIEVKDSYILRIPGGRLRLAKLPPPSHVVAPLRTDGAYDSCDGFQLKLTASQLKILHALRGTPRAAVDILIGRNQAQALAVPDPDMVRHGGTLGLLPLQAFPVAEWTRVEQTAELVLRSRRFIPDRCGNHAVTCKIQWLPQESRHWLIATVRVGQVTAVFLEPLRLVRERCRQRPATEIDAELATLVA